MCVWFGERVLNVTVQAELEYNFGLDSSTVCIRESVCDGLGGVMF